MYFSNIIEQVGDKDYKIAVYELPSFHNGLCYVIETNIYFNDFSQEIWITVEKNEEDELKGISIWLTNEYEYLGVSHTYWGDFNEFKISVPFGEMEIPKITITENVLQSLDCKKSDSEYVSTQQCLVDKFNYPI